MALHFTTQCMVNCQPNTFLITWWAGQNKKYVVTETLARVQETCQHLQVIFMSTIGPAVIMLTNIANF